MIVITGYKSIITGKITIQGHANYAPLGQDIVCASVSTLVQVLIASIEQMTQDKIKYSIQPGMVDIEFRDLSEQAQFLISSFFIGVQMIADQYPNNVQIVQALN